MSNFLKKATRKSFSRFVLEKACPFYVSQQDTAGNNFLIDGAEFSKKNLAIKCRVYVKKSANAIQ